MWAARGLIVQLARFDIGELEVRAFGQKWFAGRLAQRVGKTISKVQGSRVAALSVAAPGGASQFRLFCIDREDLEISANQEEIELPSGSFALSAFDNDSSFEHVRRRYQAA